MRHKDTRERCLQICDTAQATKRTLSDHLKTVSVQESVVYHTHTLS